MAGTHDQPPVVIHVHAGSKADKANVKISLGTFLGHISLNMGMCIIPWYTFVVGILICLFIVAAGFHLIRCLFCGPRDTYEKF